MALAASDFSLVRRRGVAPGVWVITGKYTGPASYTSGGEALTNAILKAALGINSIQSILFGTMFSTSGSTGVEVAFDYASTASTQGKIRFINQGQTAHTHDIKAIGGLTSSEPLFLDAAQKFGKNAATDRTVVGSTSATTGGVVSSTAVAAGSEVTAATDLSGFTCRFTIYGC